MLSLELLPVQVKDLSVRPFVARELMLIKVRCNAAQRRELSDLADIFHGTVCDVSLTTITLELQGKEDKMHALQGLLKPYGEPFWEPPQCAKALCVTLLVPDAAMDSASAAADAGQHHHHCRHVHLLFRYTGLLSACGRTFTVTFTIVPSSALVQGRGARLADCATCCVQASWRSHEQAAWPSRETLEWTADTWGG